MGTPPWLPHQLATQRRSRLTSSITLTRSQWATVSMPFATSQTPPAGNVTSAPMSSLSVARTTSLLKSERAGRKYMSLLMVGHVFSTSIPGVADTLRVRLSEVARVFATLWESQEQLEGNNDRPPRRRFLTFKQTTMQLSAKHSLLYYLIKQL